MVKVNSQKNRLVKNIYHHLPACLQKPLAKARAQQKKQIAWRAWQNCRRAARFQSMSLLEEMMTAHHPGPGEIRYDEPGLEIRAIEKINQLKKRVPLSQLGRTLELGCREATVAAKLQSMRHEAMGLDLDTTHFSLAAQSAGVQLLQGDVSNVPLPSQSVDLVYSFAAFEHFSDPKACLSESLRVLKNQGYLYFSFGPVYTSPYGLHAYREIPIPYCQYLFTDDDLRRYAKNHALRHEWPYVNGWTVEQYRQLWKLFEDRVDVCYYKEHPSGAVGAEWIAKYPESFKGRVDFMDLFVSGIEISWRKK